MSKINENFLIRSVLGGLIITFILAVGGSISYFISTANETAAMASEGARWTQDEQNLYMAIVENRLIALEDDVYRLDIEMARRQNHHVKLYPHDLQ